MFSFYVQSSNERELKLFLTKFLFQLFNNKANPLKMEALIH